MIKSVFLTYRRLESFLLESFAAGRLDYRTEGLLILSNDGDFVHKLTHPKYKLPRSYYVLVNGKLDSEQINQIENGIKLKDGMTLPTKLKVIHGKNLGKSQGTWYSITVYEGRNRLVRRLFEHFELNVVKLVRYGIWGSYSSREISMLESTGS